MVRPALSWLSLLVTLTGVTAAEPARVALLHGSFGNYRHRDDYDGVARELGWRLDKFENQDFGKLVGQLDQYDLVLGTALFNYEANVQDFAQWREPLLAWLQRGGALLLSDCNYPAHVDWLARLGDGWGVGLANCQTTSTPNKWLDASHPVFSADHPVRTLGATWMHLKPAAGWQSLARCADDGATVLFRTHGRGFVVVSANWPFSAAQLRNFQATRQYTRAGFLPAMPDVAALTFGDNALTTGFRNLTDQPLTVKLALAVNGPGGLTLQTGSEATAPGGQAATMRWSVRLLRRGAYDLSLTLAVAGGARFALPAARLVLPELVETRILEPAYRGVIMQAAPPSRVRARITLHPFEERLAGARYRARLLRGDQVLATHGPQTLPAGPFEVSLPFADTGRGDCTLELALLPAAGDTPLHVERTVLPVVAPRTPQVLIDPAGNTRVNGQPFFPIALYHVPAKDFARVKALGFNTVQAWGTKLPEAKANLDAAQANGLMVILEGATYAADKGDLSALDPALKAFGDHPALLSWYLTDEPSGDAKLAWCRRVHQYLAAKDPHHPVFMTSCSPGEFGAYAPVTDIFAVDPYPIPSAPVTMVSDWMQRAQTAVTQGQPVWLIPQLHNWAAYDGHPEKGRYPTPEEERNMVYQGLVWNSKAIFYYPWDDGSTGLIKDAKLMAAVGRINAELAQLGPELLTRQAEVTAKNEAPHKGLYAATYRGQGATYVVAASVDHAAREFGVPLGRPDAAAAEVLFEDRRVAVAAGVLRDQFAPLGVHVYRLP